MGKRRARSTRGLEAKRSAPTTQDRAAAPSLQAPRVRHAPRADVQAEALPALFRVDLLGEPVPLNARAAQLADAPEGPWQMAVLVTAREAIRTNRRRLHSQSSGPARRLLILAEPIESGTAQVLVLPLTWLVDLDGDPERLTPREREVLQLLLSGMNPQGIADSLRIKPNTVRTYLKSLHRIFQVSTRVELIAGLLQAVRPQLDEPEPLEDESSAPEVLAPRAVLPAAGRPRR